MAKMPYTEPPIELKESNPALFNYLRELQILVQGIGPDSSANLDSDNVDFSEAEDRSNHTGTQLSSTVSDFSESVDDRVASLIQDGEALTWNYNDVTATLTGEVTKASNPGDLTIVTTETAGAAYTANEQTMLNNLKTDVTNIIAKANLLLVELQAAKLMEV